MTAKTQSLEYSGYMSKRLRGPWLWVARLLWLAIIALMAAQVIANLNLLTPEAARNSWLVSLTYPGAFSTWDQFMAFSVYLVVLRWIVTAFFFLIAFSLAWRRSDDWLVLFISAVLVMISVSLVLGIDVETFTDIPLLGELPLVPDIGQNLIYFGFLLLFYLFPDGRFSPGWMRWVALALVLIIGLSTPIFERLNSWISPQFAEMYSWPIFMAVFIIGIVAGLAGQFYKYRRESTPIQRQQTRLVVIALLLQLSTLLVGLFAGEGRPWQAFVSLHTGILIPLLLPLAIAAAVLRHNLWDLDLIIRRTLIYGVLTLVLVMFYIGSIVLLQAVFSAVSGQQSAVAVVISTLIIAALFNPLRHRVQAVIDRRFFRRKYDAAQTLARFAITARDEVDLERLTAELVKVVNETMRPERVTLWIKENKK